LVSPAHENSGRKLVKAWLARLIVDEAEEARLRCRSGTFVLKNLAQIKANCSFYRPDQITNAFRMGTPGARHDRLNGENAPRPNDVPELAVHSVCRLLNVDNTLSV